MKLTEKQIEQYVRVSIIALLDNFKELHQTEVPHIMNVLSTALASVELEDVAKIDLKCDGVSQPRLTIIDCAPGFQWMAVNLNEVENLVQEHCTSEQYFPNVDCTKEDEECKEAYRKAIGYTLNDLNK